MGQLRSEGFFHLSVSHFRLTDNRPAVSDRLFYPSGFWQQ